MLQTEFVEKIKTHILFSVNLYLNPFHLGDDKEKFRMAGEVTDDNMTHAQLRYISYATNTLIIYNSYCFSTATMFARTRFNVMSYVHYLSCYTYLVVPSLIT
jgi:hypothetical protein